MLWRSHSHLATEIFAFPLELNAFFLKFIYFERECESRGETETEGERKRIPSRLHTVSAEPNVRLKLTNCEIMI